MGHANRVVNNLAINERSFVLRFLFAHWSQRWSLAYRPMVSKAKYSGRELFESEGSSAVVFFEQDLGCVWPPYLSLGID